MARLTSRLLDKSLISITGLDIQEALNAIEGTRRTVEITRTFLNMAFKQAVDNRIISDNPVTKTVLPKPDRTKSEPLSHSEQNDLEAFCFSLPRVLANGKLDKRDLQRQVYKDALLLILQTGISRGECLGIEWTDISFETLEIHIRGTKNESRDRVVFMTSEITEMLQRRKVTARINFVFETYKGTQLDPHNLWQFMRSKFGHSVHELRHTYITRGAQAGVNPKVLQTLTGHAKVETLLSIYTHVSDEDRAAAANKIDVYCKSTANPAPDS